MATYRQDLREQNVRTPLVVLILLTMSGRLTPAQPSTLSWTEIDAPNDVWGRDLEGGTQEFIALPHPPSVFSGGQGAAWGGRIERDGTLSYWFTVQYVGRTALGVEVVLRRGVAMERSKRSFRNADQACSRPELPALAALERLRQGSACRARAIMLALLDGDGAFVGPGTRTVLSNRPFSFGLRVVDSRVPTSAPDLTLTFEDAPPTAFRLRLTRP